MASNARVSVLWRSLTDVFPRRRDSYKRYGGFSAQAAITVDSLPLLALALAAAANARLAIEHDETSNQAEAFAAVVSGMDRADIAYLRTIVQTLPDRSAVETLTAMAEYRRNVREIRQQAIRRISELYSRYQRSYGWFDPIDPYTPSPSGLPHADGMRVAAIADDARVQVDTLKTAANKSVTDRLAASDVELLIGAKRLRREAFALELEQVLQAGAYRDVPQTSAQRYKTLNELTDVADGWY